MRWIERIVVRAADTRRWPTVRRLVDQFTPIDRPQRLTAVTLYRNAIVETDICIHLQWERRVNDPSKSDMGIELVAALEAYGRIHHTIWIEDGRSEDE